MEGPNANIHSLEFDRVSLQIDERPLLKDISFRIDAPEMVGILGPNGAGKSTFLRLCTGILSPSRGTVLLGGRPLRQLPRRAVAREIALVPQDTHVEFPFTALDVVLMGRSPHLGRFRSSSKEDREIALRAMARTETEDLAERNVTTLSGGERQRVLLARALTTQSPFIALDEPTANLDVEHCLRFLELARDLTQREDRRILIAMHDLALAERTCDRLLLFHNGRLIADGLPRKVLSPERIRDVFRVEGSYVGEEKALRLTLPGPKV